MLVVKRDKGGSGQGVTIEAIDGRDDFDRRLCEAIVAMQACVEAMPEDATLRAVLRQLEAIKRWTAGGATMNAEQVQSIVMGLQAQREMADFPRETALVIAVHNFVLRQMGR